MANKINEIIEALNGSETVEGLTTRVDNLDDSVDNLDDRVTDTESDIQILEDKVDEIENPVWVLCDDVSSIYELFTQYIDRGCGKFVKDVKMVFNLKYQYTNNGNTILNAFYTTTIYFKKDDIFRNDTNVFPVINGKIRFNSVTSYNISKLYIDLDFHHLLTQSIHYRPYTESVDENNIVHSYITDLTCSRQNEEVDYEEDSFINIYVLEGEND